MSGANRMLKQIKHQGIDKPTIGLMFHQLFMCPCKHQTAWLTAARNTFILTSMVFIANIFAAIVWAGVV